MPFWFLYNRQLPAWFFFLKNQCHANAGLSCTYVGLYLMSSGQPALLYLVPSTLGTRATEILISFYTFWWAIYQSSYSCCCVEFVQELSSCLERRGGSSVSSGTPRHSLPGRLISWFDTIGCRLNTGFGLARLVTCAHVSDGFRWNYAKHQHDPWLGNFFVSARNTHEGWLNCTSLLQCTLRVKVGSVM